MRVLILLEVRMNAFFFDLLDVFAIGFDDDLAFTTDVNLRPSNIGCHLVLEYTCNACQSHSQRTSNVVFNYSVRH